MQVRPLKLLGLGGLLDSFTDDDEEVLSQNEGNSLPLVAELLLLVVQEVTEVNVEQLEEEEEEELGGGFGPSRFRTIGLTHLPVLLHHDVGVVSVSDPQDEGGDAVTCTRPGEQVNGPVIPERQTGGQRVHIRL